MKNSNVQIRKFRILYLPLIFTLLSFIMLSLLSYYMASGFLENQMIESNSRLVELLSRKIQNELISNEIYVNQITEVLKNAGDYALKHKEQISNEYLAKMADAFQIDHIYYYTLHGELVNSSDESYIGWTPKEGDPIQRFLQGGQDSYVEDIRKGTETDDYYKFVYVRSDEGDFIQLGYRLETIEHLTPQRIIQTILEQIVYEDDYLLYAHATDRNLIVIADTDVEDIGYDYSEDDACLAALGGSIVADHWYYEKLDETVINVSAPLVIHDQAYGIVTIGISQNELQASSLFMAAFIFLSTMLVALGYLLIQRKNVINPINRLCNDIDGIDPQDAEKDFTYRKDFILLGIYESIHNLLTRLKASNRKVEVLNKEITKLAYQDYLTKLPNRYSFISSFNEMLKEHKRLAIVMLDLDNFKEYNDMKGHLFGDEILVLLSKRINEISDEKTIVSRFGGDEFLLAIGFEYRDELMTSMERVEGIFIEPFEIRNEIVNLRASVGVSLYPDDGEELGELISYSDLAMYEVKKSEKAVISFYKENMKTEKKRHVHIKRCLNDAIEHDGFTLLYQPILDVVNNRVKSYEALLRFRTLSIYPDEFIPIAESTGLIIPIGRWVIESAVKQIAQWKSENHSCTDISINFSAKQFYDDEIIEFIEQKLKQYDIPSNCLTIEITETLLLEKDIDETRTFLVALKALGIELALDDFGTGFTSVMFFNKFPFDLIKLDKSFTYRFTLKANIGSFEKWLTLFNEYGYSIVAEGVETESQFMILKELGVDFVQGYLFSRPIAPELIS